MKIATIVGTRPNFIKIAPLVKEFKRHNIGHILVHTGQHYDKEMSRFFFDDLGLPKPDINLEVGSESREKQIKMIKQKLEPILGKQKPDLVVVVGDVNSTLAGAEAARNLGIKVAHVEAGLRSFDKTMVEELNRKETDKISDFLFTTEKSGNNNLLNEGIFGDKIFFVGNVMIDTLLKHREKAKSSKILQKLNLNKKNYCVLTLHRPSNVDSREGFENILSILGEIQEKIKIVFPIHPRTKKSIGLFKLEKKIKNMGNLIITEPLGYLDFLCLMANSKLVLTDSGGIQEETTILQVPCITLRNNTERPVTVSEGTNMLVSTDKNKVVSMFHKILKGADISSNVPELWDGNAAKRIVDIIRKHH